MYVPIYYLLASSCCLLQVKLLKTCKFPLTSLPFRVYHQQVLLLVGTECCYKNILSQDGVLFAKTIIVFPWRPYTRKNFPCPKTGMTSFWTRLLGMENCQFLPYTRANKTCCGKRVKKNLLADIRNLTLFIASLPSCNK